MNRTLSTSNRTLAVRSIADFRPFVAMLDIYVQVNIQCEQISESEYPKAFQSWTDTVSLTEDAVCAIVNSFTEMQVALALTKAIQEKEAGDGKRTV